MAVNLASKYSTKVDERFKLKSLTEIGINREYDWTGVKTVSVYSIPTVSMNDYSRTGLARYGTASELQDTKQDMTLSKDRSFTFTIDRGNYNEQLMVKSAGKALARQIDEVIVPEVDTYRLAAMSAAAIANSGTATAAITSSNAYSSLLDAGEFMSDNKVPLTGRVAFVTPAYYNLIKQDNSFIRQAENSQGMLVSGVVGTVDGVKIVVVPSSYFPANHAFIVAHPSATVAASKLEDYKTHDNPPGINGWLVEGRIIYDAFVLNNKVDALYAHKTA
jgi:N4-gp56 family major capsid protein